MSETDDQAVVSDPTDAAPDSDAPVAALPVDSGEPLVDVTPVDDPSDSQKQLLEHIAAAFVDESVNVSGEAMIDATEVAVADARSESGADTIAADDIPVDEVIEPDDELITDDAPETPATNEVAEAGDEPEAEPASASASEPQSDSQADIQPDPEPDPEPAPELQAAVAELAPEAEAEPQPEPDLEPVIEQVPADMDIKDVDAMLADAAELHEVDDEDFLDDAALSGSLDDVPVDAEPLDDVAIAAIDDESEAEAAARLMAEGFGDEPDGADIATRETEPVPTDVSDTEIADDVDSVAAEDEEEAAPVLVAASEEDDEDGEGDDSDGESKGKLSGLVELANRALHAVPLTYTVSRLTRVSLSKVNAPYTAMSPTTQKALPMMSLATAMMGFLALAMAMMR